jgi:SPP1 gp7 family putative phage head morphogenesis protein
MPLDRKGKRSRWETAKGAESRYNSQLRAVAREIGNIVRGYGPSSPGALIKALTGYSDLLTPWAESVAEYMIADVNRRNERAWKETGKEMGKALRMEIAYAPTGQVFTMLMADQVELIRSIPLDAAKRVHDLTIEGLSTGERAASIAREIMKTEEVSKSKATLIARTEVARAASTLTEARATFVGSEGYIWRSSGDGDVRPTHKEMNGKYVRWDKPPITDKGLGPYHAGCGPNCRCYPDPVIPD